MASTELRIVLLGKTGAGKSSSGNTILGRRAFDVSPTEQSQEETGEVEGQTLAVVDTPGLFNSRLTDEQVKKEIMGCISLDDPGPCVFLIVIHAGRFTKEEQKAVKIIKQMFGEEAADQTMVLFTCGDDVDADGDSIDTIISDNPALQDFIKQCYGEFYIFNNRNKDCSQVRQLLQKINTMVQNKGKRNLTNEMFKEARKEEDIGLPRGPRLFNQANPAPGGDTILKGEAGEQELRIVLIGKTGGGKSLSGNTILRRKAFPVSTTTQCQEETGEFEGQTLAVVDTPGLFNTKLNEEQVKKEISRCISLPAPGPHVCLVVIHAGRFTKEEQETVNIIQQIFEKTAGRYMMVLFTRGDDLEADGMTISEIINDNPALHVFIKCCGEFHIFNNRNMDPSQVRELLKKINTMIQRNRGSYNSSEFSEAQREIEGEGREDKKRTHTRTSEMPFDLQKKRHQRENLIIQSNPDDRPAAFGAGASEAEKQELRVVLIGKTGAGKSSSANTILGRNVFTMSCIEQCQEETGEVEGQTLTVVDTPGLFNSRLSEEQVKTEIRRFIPWPAPGPYVFLVVLWGGRFTKEDQSVIEIIKKMWGEDAVHYTMALFTHGDDLLADGEYIETIISNNQSLSNFTSNDEKRYHVFNNRSRDPAQVRELLEKINKIVEKNLGRYYSKEKGMKSEKTGKQIKKSHFHFFKKIW